MFVCVILADLLAFNEKKKKTFDEWIECIIEEIQSPIHFRRFNQTNSNSISIVSFIESNRFRSFTATFTVEFRCSPYNTLKVQLTSRKCFHIFENIFTWFLIKMGFRCTFIHFTSLVSASPGVHECRIYVCIRKVYRNWNSLLLTIKCLIQLRFDWFSTNWEKWKKSSTNLSYHWIRTILFGFACQRWALIQT